MVDPEGDSVGSQTFTVRQLADKASGSITLGTPLTFSTGTTGQVAAATFGWGTNDALQVLVTGSTVSGRLCYCVPGGNPAGCTDFAPGKNAPYTVYGTPGDTWTLKFDPSGPATGKATVKLTPVVP